MTNRRSERYAGEIRREIGEIITEEVKDPRMKLVSVLEVVPAADLSSARVYLTTINDNKEEVIAVLNKAKGFIRRELAKRLKARQIPELIFVMDDSIAYGIKMTGIIAKQIESDEKAAKTRPPLDESIYEK